MHNTTKLKKRILRKCWSHIQQIQTAGNMLAVDDAIRRDAMADVFGSRNSAVWGILMKEAGATQEEVDLKKSRKKIALEANRMEIMRILISYIPQRFHKTIMYQELLNRVALSNCQK
jgi:hypothetical protein